VFVKRGYHAATLDEVASTAGFTKGVVYARFASKAELMFALLEERLAQRAEQMQRALIDLSRNAHRSPSAIATVLARQWAALTRSDADWSLLVLEFRVHVARDRALNARFRSLHTRMRHLIASAFGGSDHPSLPPDDLARIAMVFTDGFALERAVDPDAMSGSFYETAAAALLKGLHA
jgi:AcrR family transcriptional regulator